VWYTMRGSMDMKAIKVKKAKEGMRAYETKRHI
jgi:hypothetical protein